MMTPSLVSKAPVLEVVSPGFLSSVQDFGRKGWTHLGISPGGAADPQALRLGNRLLGNRESAAAIEMTLTGGRFRFLKDTWIAVTGGECQLEIDGAPMAMWYSFPMRTGETLAVGSIGPGARAYLCVQGGIDVPLVLGSRATFLSGGWGGFLGRRLESGDRLLSGGDAEGVPNYRRVGSTVRSLYRRPAPVRVTKGPQWDWFSDESRRMFFSASFQITNEADRKGIRLSGPQLEALESKELLTEGVSQGAIQVPASGQPLILYCEQQTTGGYPKIANVIRADLFRVGQLRPGDSVVFEEVEFEEAWRIDREREELCQKPLI